MYESGKKRVWFLSRDTRPDCNSAEVVNLSWAKGNNKPKYGTSIGSIDGPGYHENGDFSETEPVQILHVFTDEQGKIIEAMQALTEAAKSTSLEPFDTFRRMLTMPLHKAL